MGDVIDINANKPHAVIITTCNQCGHRVVSVVPATADYEKLECSKCGAMDNKWENP
jgi:transcription elongation factor Elf1